MNRVRHNLRSPIVRFACAFASTALIILGLGNIEGIWAPVPYLAGTFWFFYAWVLLRVGDAAPVHYGPDVHSGNLFVSVIVPVYNENPKLLRRVLDSISQQSRQPDRVWVIDDGSSVEACAEVAEKWASEQAQGRAFDTKVIIKPQNQGKRSALAIAFKADEDAEIFFTVDSDTILDSEAIAEGLKPFADPEIQAVAGTLSGHNRDENLLTRIVDMEFSCGFLVFRAAMSRFGAVLVTCGSLAAYRAEICREHTDDLLNEHFLGVRVENGDDRKLTQFALQCGKVVIQEKCIGKVALPQSLGHLLRQRLRWSTSFYRGTVYMLRTMPLNNVSFWLTLFYAGAFLAQILVIIGIIFFGAAIGWMNIVLVLTAIFIPNTLLWHWRYWNSEMVDRSRAGPFEYASLAVLATLMSWIVLMPLRFLALLKLRSTSWRTREQVEAVTLAQSE